MGVHSLGTLTTNTNTITYTVKRARNAEKGELIVAAQGTFDTATAEFFISFDGGSTFLTMGADATFVANGTNSVPVTGGDSLGTVKIRGTLSSVGTTSVEFFVVDNY